MEKIIYNNKEIYYKVQGKGTAVVLLHGFLESHKIWDNFTNTLSKSYQVIVIDLPGHGQSEVISETHSMELMADVVNSILVHLKINKASIIGHSMGGYVALAFADVFKEKTIGLGLFHSHPFEDKEEAKENRLRTIKIIENNKQSFINTFIPSLFSPVNQETFKESINFLKSQANKTSKEGIIAALKGMMIRPNRTKILLEFNKPLMFILGTDDTRIDYKTMLDLISNIKLADTKTLNNVGHMGFIEAEATTIEFMSKYLSHVNNYI
jgi:pimeloyl-ACP methyl ester carboxylesterase